jgi:hypothetical protein
LIGLRPKDHEGLALDEMHLPHRRINETARRQSGRSWSGRTTSWPEQSDGRGSSDRAMVVHRRDGQPPKRSSAADDDDAARSAAVYGRPSRPTSLIHQSGCRLIRLDPCLGSSTRTRTRQPIRTSLYKHAANGLPLNPSFRPSGANLGKDQDERRGSRACRASSVPRPPSILPPRPVLVEP